MKSSIVGLLASTIVMGGCASTMARHDVFERSELRIGRTLEAARRVCRAAQPNDTVPSAAVYERCLVSKLQPEDRVAVR